MPESVGPRFTPRWVRMRMWWVAPVFLALSQLTLLPEIWGSRGSGRTADQMGPGGLGKPEAMGVYTWVRTHPLT